MGPVPVSALAAFLGAWLLFLAQPLLAKALLPRVGGSPATWNAVQAYFQATLLGGYAWAHLVVTRAGPRRGALLQAPLLLLPLPLLATRGLLPAPGAGPGEGSPLPWVLLTLAGGVGLPALALATTAPLVQAWLLRREPGRDPRPLYAASNAGSLLALLLYPLLVEPLLPLAAQGTVWCALYAVWAALLLGLGLSTRGAGSAAPQEPPAALPRGVALRWVALAAVPASTSLGVTQYLSTDLAPVPLLWVAPLAVYLLTWIVAFWPGLLPPAAAARALPLALVAVSVAVVFQAGDPLPVVVGLHLAGLLAVGLACHGQVAASPPPAGRLTAYYLLLAAGGALGGGFNALLAPLLFPGLAEYPLALCLAALLLPTPERSAGVARRLEAIRPAWRGLAGLALDLGAALPVAGVYLACQALGLGRVGLMLAALGVYLASRRPLRLALALLALFLAGHVRPPETGSRVSLWQRVVAQERTFYGVHRLCRAADGDLTALLHGTTIHGLERRVSAPGEPLAYYHRRGPLGELLGSLPVGDPRLARVAAIGLGAGSIAAYAPAGSRWTFLELDPSVQRLAEAEFSFLTRARARGCQLEVRLGDGRLLLERRVAPGELGLLVLDAFASDSVPVHLLTRQALELYVSRLAPGGLLCAHVSSRYLDLVPVLAAHARDLGLVGRHWRDAEREAEEADSDALLASGLEPSHWVVLTRREADLPPGARRARWAGLPAPGPAWSDDWSNLLAVLGKEPE